MDAITNSISGLPTGMLQPLAWLGAGVAVITIALLLGWMSPLALRVEEAMYRLSVQSSTSEERNRATL
jgi:uncharacterized membrane protein YfcA